jgi:exosortase sorting signal-containing protein
MTRILVGVLLTTLLNVAAADATVIYGSVFSGPEGASTLWAFSPGAAPTSFARVIGPIGFLRVGALDFSPGGTLYGVGNNSIETFLITINVTTGVGRTVGSLGLGDISVQDIAFRPSDGTLFAFAQGDIFTIDTTTGAATLVGDAAVGFPFGNSLAFQGTTLYYANESNLYTINQSTGVATVVRPIVYKPAFGTFPRPPAMKFDPGNGTLWMSVVGGSNAIQDSLGTLDPATGQTTVVAPLPPTTDGIAVTAGALPAVVAVPTLSEWAQIAMVAALILVGLAALRRRRMA